MPSITYEAALKLYKSPTFIAEMLGVSRQAVHSWRKAGIPYDKQRLLHLWSYGKLKLTVFCAICGGKIRGERSLNVDICIECSRRREKQMSNRKNGANRKVKQAVKKGILPPVKGQKCKDCGRPATCYDHRDYRKPLEVDAVCDSCDSKRGHGRPYPRYPKSIINGKKGKP